MSLEKTEVMWVGHQREELTISLDGKEIKHVDEGYRGWAFKGRSETSHTSGRECLEECRGSHVGQKRFEKAERESPECACYTGMPVRSGDSGIVRTTTTAAASL